MIFEPSTIDFVGRSLSSGESLIDQMLINSWLINILINKTCSRALDVKDLPTKLMVLSSNITKITSENLNCLFSDLIAKGQPCPIVQSEFTGK